MSDTISILEQRVTQFEADIKEVETKIDNMLEKVEHDETKLNSGQKGSVTKWNKKVTNLQAKIDAIEVKISAANKTKTENSTSSPSQSGGDTKETKALKALIKDFQRQPIFAPGVDIAVFVRSMQMLWNSHVKYDSSLESDFTTLVEGHISTAYRIQLQKYTAANARFANWTEQRDYLLKTHKSCSTVFMEIQKFSNIPMRTNETVREYSARVKEAGDEAQTIIAAKYKDETSEDLTVTDVFELMMCDSIIRAMQAHP